MILPQLSRQDLYDAVFRSPRTVPQIGGLLIGTPETPAYAEVFVCPSDAPSDFDKGWTSFVANTGRVDKRPSNLSGALPFDWVENGIFHDHFLSPLRHSQRSHPPAQSNHGADQRPSSLGRRHDHDAALREHSGRVLERA